MIKTNIITINPHMLELIELAKNVAPTKATVLIEGETGTGKELISQVIHEESFRRDKKMVAINCAAIPEALMESELFGHEKGAFTGALNTRIGKFEMADGSTILLDEISELDMRLQAKLLRVLQEGEIIRLGSNDVKNLDLRIIATSNKNLNEEVENGRFRKDLYYRLNVVNIKLPPLRNRLEDIEPLAKYFIELFNRNNKKNIKGIEAQALKFLQSYSHAYEGNVRELKNIIERACLVSETEILKQNDLKIESVKWSYRTKDTSLESLEKDEILRVLMANNGNKTKAAEKLGINVRTLRYKIRAWESEAIDNLN